MARQNAPVAAGAGTGPVVISTGPGELTSVEVIVAGTAAMNFYDNTSAQSGTILHVIPASAVAGTIYQLLMGANLGITAGNALNTPQVVVSFIKY